MRVNKRRFLIASTKMLTAIIMAMLLGLTAVLPASVLAFQTESEVSPPPEGRTIGIQEAIETGLVTAEIRGNGSSSGDSIEISFELLVDQDLEIEVPNCTVLLPSGSAQRMVVWGVQGIVTGPTTYRAESTITLRAGEDGDTTYLFEAYCLNIQGDNPTSETVFTLSDIAPETVCRVLSCGDQLNASLEAIQAAVWSVTDDVSESELLARFDVSASDVEIAQQVVQCAGVDPTTLRLFQ